MDGAPLYLNVIVLDNKPGQGRGELVLPMIMDTIRVIVGLPELCRRVPLLLTMMRLLLIMINAAKIRLVSV